MISIRDHERDRNRMLNLVRRHRDELRQIIRKRIVLRHIPLLTFELDESIAQGDHVLQIISEIETQLDADESNATPGGRP
jgi:ribosome-binding factor A